MKRCRFFFLLLLLCSLLFSCNASIPKMPDDLIYGTVVRVIDGDTFIFNNGSEDIRMRLIGVDAPESVHPDESKNTEEGKAASDYTKKALKGKTVGIEYDVSEIDDYGRHLVYVWLDGMLFNKTLLADGYAVLMTVPPNVKYVDYLRSKLK